MSKQQQGSSSNYGLSQTQLTQIMDFGDKRGIKKVTQYGGIEDIANHLKTNLKDGLPPNDASLEERKREYGANVLEQNSQKSFIAYMYDAIQEPILIFLIFAAFITTILSLAIVEGEAKATAWIEGAAILAAVVIVVVVTAINDYTKERQFRGLKKQLESASKYTVIRESHRFEVSSAEIVVGDIIEFKYGNMFPCDGLLVRGNDVAVSESALTGETENIRKRIDIDPFLYAGTQVMEGTGTMLVIAVGPNSQQGIIFTLMSQQAEDDVGFITAGFRKIKSLIMKVSRRREPVIDHESMASDEQTPVEVHEIPNKDSQTEEEEVKLTFWEKINPVKIYKRRKARKIKEKKEKGESSSTSHGSVLQKKLTRLALHIGYFGMAAAVLAFLILTIKFCIDKYGAGLPAEPTDALEFLTFLTDAITVVVVAVPEGLPLAVTIALAFSVKKMLKDNNLVRHLHSCETMGNATTICSDKTGTLTTNRMTVVDSYIGQMRFNGNPPTVDDISANVLDLLKQSIAVNSNYSSVLQRPEKGLAKDTNWLKKLSRRKKPAVSSVDEVDNDKHDEPPTVEELRDLVRGVDGTLVSQVGNSTECALLGLLIELGIHYEPIREQFPKETFTKQFTFNSKRKSMSTVVPLPDGGYRVYTKGASEIVLAKCTNVLSPTGEVVPLTDPMMQDIKSSVVRNMASNALRTITLAYRDITASEILQEQPKATDQPLEESEIVELADKDVPFDWEDEDNIVKNLTCIGIVGIEDPVRDEVPESIAKCQRAGISVRMVTGDNIETAKSIAEKCGIIQRGNRSFLVLDGPTFRKKVIKKNSDGEEVVNQDALDRIWPRLRVLARSSPADKYTLVNGIINSRINKSREVVAVTGDGTNDGPALKCADVGFAMGIAGTDVAKEACDIILTDDNFASIVKAVKWGRNVYDAISKFLQFQLTVNVVAVTLVLVGSIAIGDPPLRAIQLLWVNLVMDTFASLALATEPPTDELLKRKPYGRKKPLISRRMFLFICGHSFFQLVTLIVILFRGPDLFDIDYGEHNDYFAPPSQHFTIIFNTFVFMQIFNEFNARKIHGEQNIFSNMHTNYIFIVILLGQIACQVIFVEVPFINNQIFKVTNLPGELWLWCIFLASLELVWGQILTIIPIERLPPIRLPWKKKPEPGQPDDDDDDDDLDFYDANRARLLWVKSLNRLRTQIRVVNAFKAGVESHDNVLLNYYNATPKSSRYFSENNPLYNRGNNNNNTANNNNNNKESEV